MEQLQRHQGAKLEMNMEEKHLLQAQLLLAQQAAAARASASRPDSVPLREADGPTHQALSNQMNMSEEDSDGEEREMLEPEEGDELEEEDMRLRQVSRFQPYSASLPAAVERMSEPSPSAVKEEQEEKNLSPPVTQTSFTSHNGLADWGYDELFKQVGYSIIDLTSVLTFILPRMSSSPPPPENSCNIVPSS